MTTNLASYIKQERIKHGLNCADLSRLMGYQNITRGMRRITNLERESKVHPEILMKLIFTLKLDKDIVNELLRKDKEEYEKAFEEWVNEPISMIRSE